MNNALPEGWLALTNPLITVVSLPTVIPTRAVSGSVDLAAPGTAGPAQAALETTRPATAAVLTSLRNPTVDPLSVEHRPITSPQDARSRQFNRRPQAAALTHDLTHICRA